MKFGAKITAAMGAAFMVSGCTAAEMQAFTVGLSAAASELAYQNSLQAAAYGPTYCEPGYSLEYGYDAYDNPVRFCLYVGPDYEIAAEELIEKPFE